LTVNNNRDNWPEPDRKLFEQAEPFIEAALSAYITSNNITVPKSILGGSANGEQHNSRESPQSIR
jgi:hypothetical protein